MKQRGFCYPYPGNAGVQIVESGPLGTVPRVHERHQYTLDEARQVAGWINGQDRGLETMTVREYDPHDPGRYWGQRHINIGHVLLSHRARRE